MIDTKTTNIAILTIWTFNSIIESDKNRKIWIIPCEDKPYSIIAVYTEVIGSYMGPCLYIGLIVKPYSNKDNTFKEHNFRFKVETSEPPFKFRVNESLNRIEWDDYRYMSINVVDENEFYAYYDYDKPEYLNDHNYERFKYPLKVRPWPEESLKYVTAPVVGNVGNLYHFCDRAKVNRTYAISKIFKLFTWEQRNTESLRKIETSEPIASYINTLKEESPILLHVLAFVHNSKSVNKVTNNKLLAKFYSTCTSYANFKAGVETLYTSITKTHIHEQLTARGRLGLLALPGVSDFIVETKAKRDMTYAKKAANKYEILGLNKDQYPLLCGCLEAGEIPFSLFHHAGNENKLINAEFAIIEAALTRWKDTVVAIAKNASSRSTYSKLITNYLAFILYTLPNYLNRNAPLKPKNKKKRSWVCEPKFVNSQWELEMRDEDNNETGTTKRRSALTPIVDNEKGIVQVPYAAMSISGVRTSWCYSEIYVVAEQGRVDPCNPQSGVFDKDLEIKLNGRDDYGICYYTLTGTDMNRGYPTFLIIFERTTNHGTRIHFHRVHPSRFRGPNKTATPSSNLILEGYRYMAGNIKADEIAHQQGDLLLIKATKPGKSKPPVSVFGFENHSFTSKSDIPVQLYEVTGTSRGNLLGWLYSDQGMSMPHPEHETIDHIEPGYYELRRCKSYENNPTGVWSLNID